MTYSPWPPAPDSRTGPVGRTAIDPFSRRALVVAVVLGCMLVVAYQVLLGDPAVKVFADGSTADEYAVGDVVWMGIVVVVLTTLAAFLGEPISAGFTAIAVITVSWTVDASASDESGLWVPTISPMPAVCSSPPRGSRGPTVLVNRSATALGRRRGTWCRITE
jgi:hypothetical protein